MKPACESNLRSDTNVVGCKLEAGRDRDASDYVVLAFKYARNSSIRLTAAKS